MSNATEDLQEMLSATELEWPKFFLLIQPCFLVSVQNKSPYMDTLLCIPNILLL